MRFYDAVVIGGGIAGVSAAYSLSGRGADVLVLEREESLTAHSTGRSAAQYVETYGGPQNQALAIASRDFLTGDADGWADDALLHPRAVLWVGARGRLGELERCREESSALSEGLVLLHVEEAREHCPALDAAWLAGGLLEPDGYDIDVAGLHQAFLRGARARGATVARSRGVIAMVRAGGVWEVQTEAESFAAPVVVDAAGAWADEVARTAGVAPVGLTPLRRTIFTFAAPTGPSAGPEVWRWPLVIDIDSGFYFKPEGPSQLLGSPADETPDVPGDARAREIDVARGIDALNAATTLDVRAVRSTWAGLRTFAPDRQPVVGFDDAVEGFVWCAGQGGTGIQTSPAMGEVVAAVVCRTATSQALAGMIESLSPHRLRMRESG